MWQLARAVTNFADDEFNLPSTPVIPVKKPQPTPVMRQGKFWPKFTESEGVIEILKTDDDDN